MIAAIISVVEYFNPKCIGLIFKRSPHYKLRFLARTRDYSNVWL